MLDSVEKAVADIAAGKLVLVEELAGESENEEEFDWDSWLQRPVSEIMEKHRNGRGGNGRTPFSSERTEDGFRPNQGKDGKKHDRGNREGTEPEPGR